MPQLVITAVGPDKPGLVGELTGYLHAGGANILDSRMVNLRGEFAVIVLVEAPDAALAALGRSLPDTARGLGLTVSLAPQAGKAAPTPGVPYRIKTYSMDQPGIVHRITAVLRKHRVNIEELAARQESAAFAGTPLFIMEIRVTVPAAVPVRALREELESVAAGINCDLDIEPA